jgi:hypothetical protein
MAKKFGGAIVPDKYAVRVERRKSKSRDSEVGLKH